MAPLTVGLLTIGWFFVLFTSLIHYLTDDWDWQRTFIQKAGWILGGAVLWGLLGSLAVFTAYHLGLAILGGS